MRRPHQWLGTARPCVCEVTYGKPLINGGPASGVPADDQDVLAVSRRGRAKAALGHRSYARAARSTGDVRSRLRGYRLRVGLVSDCVYPPEYDIRKLR
jgi:hypothetical protein